MFSQACGFQTILLFVIKVILNQVSQSTGLFTLERDALNIPVVS